MADRKYLDCREMPSESGCDLTMSGSEQHLVEAGRSTRSPPTATRTRLRSATRSAE